MKNFSILKLTRMLQIEQERSNQDQNVLVTFVADFPGNEKCRVFFHEIEFLLVLVKFTNGDFLSQKIVFRS